MYRNFHSVKSPFCHFIFSLFINKCRSTFGLFLFCYVTHVISVSSSVLRLDLNFCEYFVNFIRLNEPFVQFESSLTIKIAHVCTTVPKRIFHITPRRDGKCVCFFFLICHSLILFTLSTQNDRKTKT